MGSLAGSSGMRKTSSREFPEMGEALHVEVLDPTAVDILGKPVPKRQASCCCNMRLREIAMAVVILALAMAIIVALASNQKTDLPPYCLFAIGGGYLEGTQLTARRLVWPCTAAAFPQEERLASKECNKAIRTYLTNGRYQKDVEGVVEEAMALLKSIPSPNASQVLVFDIDETVLSNMKEFEHMRFGKKPYDARWEKEWQLNGTAPALKPMLELYKGALRLGFSVTFLTGRHEMARDATESNLKNEGFGVVCQGNKSARLADAEDDVEPCYVRLDVRDDSDKRPASVYKPERRGVLQEDGYILLASFGDQWSDLTGPNLADANFKLPNPMYYLL